MMNISMIKQKLYLDKHHRMEHFGIMFVVFIFLLSTLMVWAAKIKADMGKYKMTGESNLSVTPVEWSKTGTRMAINKIYTNKDNTKVMVWLKMDNMDMQSTDPNEYRVYLSSYKDMKISHPVSGSLYMFGDTGNMALMLYDGMGFENAVFEIIMRGTAIAENPDYQHKYSDDTFNYFNQSCFYINPTGSDAEVVDFLDDDVLDARSMYYEGALIEPLTEIKDRLNEDVHKLKTDVDKYNQCIRVLKDADFVIPSAPLQISGDYISNNGLDAASSPVTFDPAMLDLDEAVIVSEQTVSDDDVSAETASGDQYYYISNFVYPGGINIDINDITSVEFALNNIKPAGLTYYEWLSDQKDEASAYDKVIGKYDYKTDSWQQGNKVYKYGTVERYDTAINKYNDAVSQLMADKRKYETESIYRIFECISDLDTVADKVAINSNSDFVTQWNHYK